MSKSILFSSLIIAITVAFIAVNSTVSSKILKNFEEELMSSEDTEEYRALEEQFDKRERYLSFFIPDNVLLEIHAAFGEIIAYSEEGSTDEMNAAKNRLCARLGEQRRLCGLNFSSVF